MNVMKKLYRIYEFLFNRWKKEIYDEGAEAWHNGATGRRYQKDYVRYKYTNKFDGSTKIVKEYTN